MQPPFQCITNRLLPQQVSGLKNIVYIKGSITIENHNICKHSAPFSYCLHPREKWDNKTKVTAEKNGIHVVSFFFFFFHSSVYYKKSWRFLFSHWVLPVWKIMRRYIQRPHHRDWLTDWLTGWLRDWINRQKKNRIFSTGLGDWWVDWWKGWLGGFTAAQTNWLTALLTDWLREGGAAPTHYQLQTDKNKKKIPQKLNFQSVARKTDVKD